MMFAFAKKRQCSNMTFHSWFAFLLAAALLLIIPGPTVLQCIGDTLVNGRSWAPILGVGVGDATAMTLSLLGAGALLRSSAIAFIVLRTVGGLYLIFLGSRTVWNAGKTNASGADAKALVSTSFRQRLLKVSMVTMLNPKSLLFFVAFLPQFINPAKGLVPQAELLVSTFLLLTMMNAWMYVAFASSLGSRMQSDKTQRRIGYASGSVLLAAGVLTLRLSRR